MPVRFRLQLAAVLLLAAAPDAGAQALRQRESLRGLREIKVSVTVNRDARRAGIDSARVATSVEYELRRSGLRVGTGMAPGDDTGFASAAVDCVEVVTATRSMGFACYVAFSVDQMAKVSGSDQYAPTVRARTWHDGTLLLNGGADLETRVHADLRGMLERLGNALLAANGR